jgi:hypothetical protein
VVDALEGNAAQVTVEYVVNAGSKLNDFTNW